MSNQSAIITRMKASVNRWNEVSDDRALFLSCYMRMTQNMLDAVARGAFADAVWVDRLLHHFAGYYFDALQHFDSGDEDVPAVWKEAFVRTADPDLAPLQKLLLGVNAHINYDLVFSLYDMLEAEWAGLDEGRRSSRYADHCRVNVVIGNTIDAVQDEILEPGTPALAYVDVLMGPLDEYLISHVIASWRETVWQHALGLLGCGCVEDRDQLVRRVEADTLGTARLICSV